MLAMVASFIAQNGL